MTKKREKEILANPSTHSLVHDVLDMAQDEDCIDAYFDVLLAADILRARMDRVLGNNN